MSISTVLQLIFSGITIGSIYALVAIGFNIVYNATGIINFAHGEFVMLGGLIMVTLTKTLGIPMYIGFFIAVLIVSIVGALFERLAINPLKKPTVLVLIIITIAGSILLKGAAMILWGKQTFDIPHFSGEEPYVLLGATILPQTIWILLVLISIVILLFLFFRFTLVGKAMQACSANRTSASLVGINVRKMVLLAFSLSAGIGAVAGIMVTPITMMDYGRGAILALKGFGVAILGGLGNMFGAVIAGLVIGILESFGAYHLSGYKDAIALIVLLAVLFIKPSGIMGSKEVSSLKDF
jgi:branched-chain amino acid transport system permease protein